MRRDKVSELLTVLRSCFWKWRCQSFSRSNAAKPNEIWR